MNAARANARGQALIVALALILAMVVITAGSQLEVVIQLQASKTQRNYERALVMAESGANAYLNMLSNGAPGDGVTNGSLVPPQLVLKNPDGTTATKALTLAQFRTELASAVIPAANLIHYPAGQTGQGYFAAQIGSVGLNATVVSYGWCGGAVRMVKLSAAYFNLFNWAAIYALDPNTSDNAWTFNGSATIYGSEGSEGNIKWKSNNPPTIYGGPLMLDNGTYASPYNVPDTTISTTTGWPLASPLYIHNPKKLAIETADQAANRYSGTSTTSGLEYFRTHNNNATGLRYLVWDGTNLSSLRELGPKSSSVNYAVIPTGSYTMNGSNGSAWGGKFGQYKNQGALQGVSDLKSGEQVYGVRAYPGDYFFEQISMQPSNVLWIRSYNDADRATDGFTNASLYPANPNPSIADGTSPSSERMVRFWLGHTSGAGDQSTGLGNQTTMEDTTNASRFRIYVASTAGLTIGNGGSGTTQFYANILAYNQSASYNGGNPYGSLTMAGGSNLEGSLIGWQVTVTGNSTIIKQNPENETPAANGTTTQDVLAYSVTSWSELQ